MSAVAQEVQYLTAKACSRRYGFSVRHWLRLVDSSCAPRSTRFGRLTRWSLKSLEEWESQGCPRCDRRGR
jgi:predicted DNA-binding transcriptional regulator AlpA